MLVTNRKFKDFRKISLKKFIKLSTSTLLTDWLFFLTVFLLLAKSILFVGLINNDTISFTWDSAFRAFGSPPPIPVYISFIVAVLGIAFVLRGRSRYFFLVTFNALFSLLLLADLLCYRATGSFLSPQSLVHSFSAKPSAGLGSMFHAVDLIFIIDVCILLVSGLKFNQVYSRARRSVLVSLILISTSVWYINSVHYALDIRGDGGDRRLFSYTWVPDQTLSNISPLGYHLFDLYSFYVKDKPEILSPGEQGQIKQWFVEQENLPPNLYQGQFRGQNLIFLQVESLENFVINQSVNGQPITPNLNRLLSNSLYMGNIYEQVYNGTSSDADLLVNTSLYPVREGITFFRYPLNTYNSLPKLLAGQGYSTVAVHADKGAHWNWVNALHSMGFEQTLDTGFFRLDEKIELGLSDGSFFKQTAAFVAQQKQPFYDFLVTLTSHGPFDLPKQYRKLQLDDKLDKSKLGGYFQSIHYTDEQIGRFLAELDKRGTLDNTVVVIYGDHSGVHKYYNDEVQKIHPQQSWWLDATPRIPLIIYHKGMQGREIATTGGQVDIMPTVAYLMGIDPSKYSTTAVGRNLLNTNKNFAVLANGKYLGTPPADPAEQAHAVKGIDIADLILRTNYFAPQKAK